MRLISLGLLVFSSTLQALTPSLCEHNTLKHVAGTPILKCDCQCTNEENSFFIQHADGYYQVDASRLLVDADDKRMKYATCGTGTRSTYNNTDGYVFAYKGPAKEGSCFDFFQAKIYSYQPPSFKPIGTTVYDKPKVSNIELTDFKTGSVTQKSYLYNAVTKGRKGLDTDFAKHLHHVRHDAFSPRKTNKYLIKGDQVTLLQQQKDTAGHAWYLVNYQGKKNLTLWLKATSVAIDKPAHLDVSANKLIVAGKTFYSPFIAAPLATQLTKANDELILNNEYLASVASKSVETLVIDRNAVTVKQFARVTYKPKHGVYVGWVLNTPPIPLPSDEKSLYELQLNGADFNYHIEDDQVGKRVNYSIQNEKKYFKYAIKQKGIYTLKNNSVHLAQYTMTADKKIVFDKMIGCHYWHFYEGNSDWLNQCFDVSDNYLSSHSSTPDMPSIASTLHAAKSYEAGDCKALATYRIENCVYHHLAKAYQELQPLLEKDQFKTWLLATETICWEYYQDVYPGNEATIDRLGCLRKHTDKKIASLAPKPECLSAKNIRYQFSPALEGGVELEKLTLYRTGSKTPLYSINLLDRCQGCDILTFTDIDFDSKNELLVQYDPDPTHAGNYEVLDIHCNKLTPHPVLPSLGVYQLDKAKKTLTTYRDNVGSIETNKYCVAKNISYLCSQDIDVTDNVLLTKTFDATGKVHYLGATQNDRQLSFKLNTKATLHTSPNKPSRMYLIKGDKVALLDQDIDENGREWFLIRYRGKKELTMWIQATQLDIDKPILE